MTNVQPSDREQTGKGLSLIGLAIGLAAGLAVYGIVEFWIDDSDGAPLPIAAIFFTVTLSGAFVLLAERGRLIPAAIGAGAVALLFVLPDWFMASHAGDAADNLNELPAVFWFLPARTLAAYLMISLIKGVMHSGFPPHYRQVFFHGLTLPLIAGGAALFAGLALILLFVWARLLKELDVAFFNKLFQEPWFLLPFIGAVGGLSIAMIRGQQSVLGALRFVLLLLCRILTPITAVFTVTLLAVLMFKGAGVIFDKPYPGAIMIALLIVGALIFNGVYQNGEGAPPPTWLRIATLITLIGFPIYAGLGFTAFALRIAEYGLTPPRIAGLAVNTLTAAYSIVCVAGLASELRWSAKRWMPPVAPLNMAMAVATIVVLTVFASPLANPWAISAKSQYAQLAEEKISAEDFDFGYLRFDLGRYGERALDKLLTLEDHPEAGLIREKITELRSADNRWEYEVQDIKPTPAAESEDERRSAGDRPETLPLNPYPNEPASPDDEL
ncbi:MAG: hypothetical protein AAGD92_02880 [Pseudomonadota bacterium]